MYLAQIDTNDRVGLLNPSEAYPGGGWETVKPLMEDMGFLFIELGGNALPGTHYDREKGEFYTPEPLPPEPTPEELTNLAIMEALATVYENQKATQEAVAQLYERGTV